jgi:hypothetical protein
LEPPPMPEAPKGIRVIANRLRPASDVEDDAPIVLAEIGTGDEGVLERVICALRDAPIFAQEGGRMSVGVVLRRQHGERVSLCAFYQSYAVTINRPLAPNGVPLRSGDVVDFSCRSFRGEQRRGPGDGCTVDVDLWIRAAHSREKSEREAPPAP